MDSPALFLSYNSSDRPSVVAIQKLLAARGIRTFLDRDQLAPGLPWPSWFALDRQVREEKHGRPFPVIPVLLR